MKNIAIFLVLICSLINMYAVSFVAMGDNRPSRDTDPPPEIFLKMLKEIEADTAVSFIVSTGDIVIGVRRGRSGRSIERQYADYEAAIKEFCTKPIFISPGNHDICNDQKALECFLKTTSQSRTYYSFDRGDIHFVCIDTAEIYNKHCISDEQFQWLKTDLQENKIETVIVFGHEPLFPISDHVGSSLDACPSTQEKLVGLFDKHDVDIYLCGHEHLFSETRHGKLVQLITGGAGAPLRTPAIFGGFYHYIRFTMTEKGLTWKLRRFPDKSGKPIKYFRQSDGKDRSYYIEYFPDTDTFPTGLSAQYELDGRSKMDRKIRMEMTDGKFHCLIPVGEESKKLYINFLTDKGEIISYSPGNPFRIYLR
ncbi:metallophosphoesterase [bacterium]|nr:metallophosphoesterase [bacterium]